MIDDMGDLDAGLQFTVKEMFGDEDSDYDLTYRNVDELIVFADGSRGEAETDWEVDANGKIISIEIRFDDLFLENATDVAIFTTILHENMHATMFYQLNQADVPINSDSDNYLILAEIWSNYVAEIRLGEGEDRSRIAQYQHEVISELIDKMFPLVKQFAIDKGYNINDTQAEAICWVGLAGTTAYDELEDSLKETYDRIILDEFDYFDVLAIGKKCDYN